MNDNYWHVFTFVQASTHEPRKISETNKIIWCFFAFRLHVKCDLEAEGQVLLQREVESKVKAEVIYSMSKVADIIVHVFKHLPPRW